MGGVLQVGSSWLDDRHDPIWVQTFPARYTDAELFYAFDRLDAVVVEAAAKRGRFCLVSDVTRARVGNAVHRRRIAQTFSRTRHLLGDRVAGQAFVMKHAMQRGALTAILWLGTPPWPIEVFAALDEAMAWSRLQLATSK